MKAELVMMVTPRLVRESSSASSAQHEPDSIMTVAPFGTSSAATVAMRRLMSWWNASRLRRLSGAMATA